MRTLNRFLAALLILGIACAGCDSKSPRNHYEKAGGFSYDPPDGWQTVEFPGQKYRVSRGPQENEFAPNINVVDESFSGTLTAYVDANLKNLKKLFANLRVLKREDFQTADGQEAIRVIAENKQHGWLLRQTFYFMGPSSRKYVVTCTTLAEGGENLDQVFEKSMKTFRIH